MTRFVPVVIAAFFISIHYGSILYLNSTLLSNFFAPDVVNLLFVSGAIGNVLLFLFAPRLIKIFGKRWLLLVSLMLAMGSTLTMSVSVVPSYVAMAFLVHAGFLFVTYYCLDIFLEEISSNTRTGEIRGVYLTIISLGITLGPLLFSFITNISGDLKLVYLVAFLLLIPAATISIFAYRSSNPKAHAPYHHSSKLPFIAWWQNKDVRHASLAKLILEAFYSFMFIFTPVYLISVIGFSLSEIGIIFAVMLLPFILFEWVTGEAADRLWGEKEIMAIGFGIMIAALLVMPFIDKYFISWMVILFLSRVGACFVEVTTESYFFKKIDSTDTALISIFRLARPISIILGALVGTLALNYLSFDKIFFVIAIVVVFGLRESLYIKDTR